MSSVVWSSSTPTNDGLVGGTATLGAGMDTSGGKSNLDDSGRGFPDEPIMRVVSSVTTADAATAVGNGSYIEFPTVGSDVAVSQVTFLFSKGGSSDPRGWELRSSADSYVATLGAGVGTNQVPTWDTLVTVDTSGVAATNNLTFRLYVYTPSTGSVAYVDDFTVETVGPQVDITTVTSDPRQPDAVLGVVEADVTGGSSNFKQSQWSLNNLSDNTTWNGAAWVVGADSVLSGPANQNVATPTVTSYDFTAAGPLGPSTIFEVRARAKDQGDAFGSWDAVSFTTGVWEYGAPITFTTANGVPVVALASPGESQQFQMPFAVADRIDVVCGTDNVVTLEGRVPQIFTGWHDFSVQMDGNGDVDTTFTLSGLETPGTYTFEMRGTAANANTTVDTNTFTVVAAPPPVASDDTASTGMDTAIVIDVLGNDSAVHPSAVLTIESPASNGTATVD